MTDLGTKKSVCQRHTDGVLVGFLPASIDEKELSELMPARAAFELLRAVLMEKKNAKRERKHPVCKRKPQRSYLHRYSLNQRAQQRPGHKGKS